MAEAFQRITTGEDLLQFGLTGWLRVKRNMEAAEAILSRSGDPADRQAMAITRLTFAELLLRRAETHRYFQDRKLAELMICRADVESHLPDESAVELLLRRVKTHLMISKLEAEVKNHLAIAEADHAESFSLLSTVEDLFNEGRGENRWRFFYLLTHARSHMFRAHTRRESARRRAILDLQWAARHLTGATANCGLWTDRYDVLGWWWDTWRSLAKQFFPDNNPAQLEKFLRETKARNGIQWSTEACARRDDRSTKA